MKLKRILNGVLLEQFCEILESELTPSSFPSDVQKLLDDAIKKGIFLNKNNQTEGKLFENPAEDKLLENPIDPKIKNYFIAGSMRFHLYPKIKDIVKLTPINDLDIVYIKLSTNEIKTSDGKIEVFNKWDPRKVSDAKDFTIRSTQDILNDAKQIGGYYFMSFYDILDYKLNLNREKEKTLTEYIVTYLNKPTTEKQDEIIQLFLSDENGKKEFKDFLPPNLVNKKFKIKN